MTPGSFALFVFINIASFPFLYYLCSWTMHVVGLAAEPAVGLSAVEFRLRAQMEAENALNSPAAAERPRLSAPGWLNCHST
jgi:hypothetical protein